MDHWYIVINSISTNIYRVSNWIILRFLCKKNFKTLEALFDCFTVVPMTLIGYFILDTVLRFQNGSPVPLSLNEHPLKS